MSAAILKNFFWNAVIYHISTTSYKILCVRHLLSKVNSMCQVSYSFLFCHKRLQLLHIIFAFSAIRRHTWFPDILGNISYPIFTKFGMQVYWVNSLYGIAFGDDSSIAN